MIKMHPSITQDKIVAAVEADDNLGFCIACGAEVGSVKPDARKYECGVCSEHAVYGAQELLFHIVA